MSMLSLIICLILEKRFLELQKFRDFSWFRRYIAFLIRKEKKSHWLSGKIALLILVLPIPMLVGYINLKLAEIFILFQILFSICILYYSIGPATFYDKVKIYCSDWEKDRIESARAAASDLLGYSVSGLSPSELHHRLASALIAISHERLFAVIFWFLLAGPAGALTYRLSHIIFNHSLQNRIFSAKLPKLALAAHLFFAILNWPAVRVSALVFAFMGNFLKAISYCSKNSLQNTKLTHEDNSTLLDCYGFGATEIPSDPMQATLNTVNDVQGVVRRSLLVWLGFTALLTLAGWL